MIDKLKQLSKETAIYGVSTMVGRFLNFLLVPLYTNIFPPSEYGIINNLYALIALLNIIFIYGMDSAYLKFGSISDDDLTRDRFSTPFISVIIIAVLFGVILTALKNSVGNFLDIPDKYHYLVVYVAIILTLDATASLPFIKLRIERKAKKFATFKLINITLNVVLNLILILKLKFGIEAILICNAIASLSSIILLFPTIVNSLHIEVAKNYLKRLLKFGLPILPAGIALMIVQVADVPILTHLTNFKTVGIYKANYRLGIFMLLFVSMFQYAWQPFFLQESKDKNAKQLFAKVLTYFTLVGSIILITLSLFLDDIVKIEILHRSIIGSAYWSGLSIVPIVLFGYLFNGIYVIFNAGLYITENSKYFPFITGLGAVVNVVANIILIPIWGIIGAALATLLAYIAIAVGIYFVTQRVYKINYEYWKITKIFITITIIGAGYYYLNGIGHLTLLYKFLLMILFLILLAVFVIDSNEINYIKKKFLKT